MLQSNSSKIVFSKPITLRPEILHGLRKNVQGSVQFITNDKLIYPLESVYVVQGLYDGSQTFLRPLIENVPIYMCMMFKRTIMAVLEKTKDEKFCITLYDLENIKQRRTISLPDTLHDKELIKMMFTSDNRRIVILTKPPDELIYIVSLEISMGIIVGAPTIVEYAGLATCLALSTDDVTFMAVGGQNFVSFIKQNVDQQVIKIEGTLSEIDFHVYSMTILENDTILLGTENDELIVVENSNIKLRTQASNLEKLDIMWENEIIVPLKRQFNKYNEFPDTKVLHLTKLKDRGFFFVIYNCLYIFELITKTAYERKTVIVAMGKTREPDDYRIQHFTIDPKLENIVVKCQHSQLYHAQLFPEREFFDKILYTEFKVWGTAIHNDGVIDISVCSWKPIIMSASKDNIIRIYNYKEKKVELLRKFPVKITVIELEASGLLAAIGFIDQLRIFQVYFDDLNLFKTYNFPNCNAIKYSNYGHLLAAGYDNVIAITSTFNLNILKYLKAHNGTVLSLAFNRSDNLLVSGGAEGAIYIWDIEQGVRISEMVQKGIEYISLAISSKEPYQIFAATQFGAIRLFMNDELKREVFLTKDNKRITDMCFSRSDQMLFVSNVACELFNVQLPLLDANGGKCTPHQYFTSKVKKLCYSHCGQMLIIGTAGGTFGIWSLHNADNKLPYYDINLLRSEEILIPRTLLCEINELVKALELRLKQQSEEFIYKINQNKIIDNEQMAQVHRTYCMILAELKLQNEDAARVHAEAMNELMVKMKEVNQDHREGVELLSNLYVDRMLIEHHKYKKLRASIMSLRDLSNEHLQKNAVIQQDLTDKIENKRQTFVYGRVQLIRKLMGEIHERKEEFVTCFRQMDFEVNFQCKYQKIEYENLLILEKYFTLIWRKKTFLLFKENYTLSQKLDEQLSIVNFIKENISKASKKINKLYLKAENLEKDIADREYVVSTKEKRIDIHLYKNQKLDKHRKYLCLKIIELKSQAEPTEILIVKKTKIINHLEEDLQEISEINMELERKLNIYKKNYIYYTKKLEIEAKKSIKEREKIRQIIYEIYKLSLKNNTPAELQQATVDLINKYGDTNELKESVHINKLVNEEFERQKNMVYSQVKQMKIDVLQSDVKKNCDNIYEENLKLMQEIEALKKTNETLKHESRTLEFKQKTKRY